MFEYFKTISADGYFGPVEIVESKTKGFYLRSVEPIPKNTIISEYVG